ncbi:MAG: DUF2892 domain-containing protein [Candidatus Micrarchaeota archaeon]|nr:DUF2892 domain-containing protein [Candidatus Micrarchaeota archaeon]
MKLFEKNIGKTDKMVRVAVGILLLAAAYLFQGDMLVRGLLGLVGVVMLVTAITSSCLLYSLIGMNTAKK